MVDVAALGNLFSAIQIFALSYFHNGDERSDGGGEGEILNGQLVFLTVINLEYIYENLKTFLVVNIFTTSDKRS